MDENKDLNEDNKELASEEVTEEVTEEATEEVAEEVTEEATEEATDVPADFAVVTDEAAEPEKPKKSKVGMIIGIVAAVVVIIAAIFACKMFLFGGGSEGTGNLYSRGFATIKGDSVYHVNFSDYKMYKTKLTTGESECVTDDYAVYITNYKNNIYYQGYKVSDDKTSFVYEYRKYVDGGDDVVLVNGEVSSPQFAGDYLYYLVSVPDQYSGYCSRIYRVSIKGGAEPELVNDVLCVSFYVDGDDLYYCDVENTAFMKVKLSTVIKTVADSPLAEGALRKSEDIGAEPVISTIVTCAARVGNTMYYVDAQNKYELLKYDMKSGESSSINDGTFAGAINIYGNYLYYFNSEDYAIYRMNLDGSDVKKITGAGYGYMAISHDKFISMEFTDDYKQYIAVCDLDGNLITEIGLNGEGSDGEATEDETPAEGEATDGETTDGETSLAPAEGEAAPTDDTEVETATDTSIN